MEHKPCHRCECRAIGIPCALPHDPQCDMLRADHVTTHSATCGWDGRPDSCSRDDDPSQHVSPFVRRARAGQLPGKVFA